MRGRTDLHEIFATFWAAVLRANGVASAELVDDENECPGEIHSRALVIRQPFDAFLRQVEISHFERVRAHSALAFHMLADAFDLQAIEPTWSEERLPWLEDVRSHLGGKSEDELFVERDNPKWRYYKGDPELTLLELTPRGGLLLREAFRFYTPEVVRRGTRIILSANGIYNAVRLDSIRKGERLLQTIDNSPLARFVGGDTRFDQRGLLVVPLETHCILVGGSGAVIVRSDCGYKAFLIARDKWEGQARRAATIFGQSGSFAWSENIDSERLEGLAEELLAVEPGVERVRSAGPHTERDQGRDLIVDWVRIVDATSEPPKFRTDLILAQVKSRNRTIGKGDVRDVRDTIERHAASGFLLIGYPQLSGDLINYLETLRQRGESIEWWTRKQLEERLRKNLNIAARFPDVVRYRPPDDGRLEAHRKRTTDQFSTTSRSAKT